MTPACSHCDRPSYTKVAPYICETCIERTFYNYWAYQFATTCAIAASNGDDDIARKRLYNELKALGVVD